MENNLRTISETDVNRTLIAAKNSSDAIRRIYELQKSVQKKFSVAFICKKAGIPSKGYLSDVMSGNRLLHKKHAQGILRGLNLKGRSANYFLNLLDFDHEVDSQQRERLLKKRSVQKKSLLVARNTFPKTLLEPFFLLEIFCRLGLHNNEARIGDLVKHFGKDAKDQVIAAIEALKAHGMVSELDGKLSPTKDQFVFPTSEGEPAHFHFLESCLNRAKSDFRSWFDRKAESYFESSIISVSEPVLKENLPKIRDFFTDLQSDLESGKADRLILFNVQVFPIE